MKIAIVQYAIVWENVEENLNKIESQLSSMEECDIVVLPEMFTSGFTMSGRHEIAMRFDETVEWMGRMAKQYNLLICGSLICLEGDNYYNRFMAVDENGVVAKYDKRHGFTYGGEPLYFAKGTEQVVFEFRGMRIAPFICYDLRFPVWSRNKGQYDIALYIANWPVARIEVWKTLLAARAIENQCYVVGVNCTGGDGNGMTFTGESGVYNSRGKCIGGCGDEAMCVRVVKVSKGELDNFRNKFPVLNDGDAFRLQ